MFATNQFVYVHLPKTGGTFVETALQRLYGRQTLNTIANKVARKLRLNVTVELPKHGTVRDIPQTLRRLTVLANMRNPFDRYVSMYKYQRYQKHPEQFGADNHVIMNRWPQFPNLSFEQYVHYMNDASAFLRLPGFASDDQPGLQTQQFLYFFTRNIEQCARNLTPESASNGRLIMMMPENIHFIFTNNLNQDLYNFLLSIGQPSHRIKFILDMRRVLPDGGGRNDSDHWEHYYTPELKDYVQRKERLLLELFPQFQLIQPATILKNAA